MSGSRPRASTSRAPCSPISVTRSRARAAVDGKRDGIAGLQSEAARRQCEGGALARGPGLEQPDLGHAGGLLGLQDEREIGDGNAPAVADEPARFLRRPADSSPAAAIYGELGGGRQVRLLGAGERGEALAGPAAQPADRASARQRAAAHRDARRRCGRRSRARRRRTPARAAAAPRAPKARGR